LKVHSFIAVLIDLKLILLVDILESKVDIHPAQCSLNGFDSYSPLAADNLQLLE